MWGVFFFVISSSNYLCPLPRWRHTEPSSIKERSVGITSTSWTCWWWEFPSSPLASSEYKQTRTRRLFYKQNNFSPFWWSGSRSNRATGTKLRNWNGCKADMQRWKRRLKTPKPLNVDSLLSGFSSGPVFNCSPSLFSWSLLPLSLVQMQSFLFRSNRQHNFGCFK